MKKSIVVLAACLCSGVVAAQPSAGERKFIREGMSEAEVVQKIGRPSYKASGPHQGGGRKQKKQGKGKTWTYFPTPEDPQTTTIITIANGQVARVERRVTY